MIFSPVSQSIKAGKLRALAVTTATRLEVLPESNGGRLRARENRLAFYYCPEGVRRPCQESRT